MRIGQKQIDAITALTGPQRYDHFIKVVVDSEELWGLYQGGWALAATNQNDVVLPLWPAQEYAQLCSKNDWEGYKPKAISLDEFMEEMLPDLKEKKILPCIFYLATDKGVIPEAEKLLEDLRTEMRLYE